MKVQNIWGPIKTQGFVFFPLPVHFNCSTKIDGNAPQTQAGSDPKKMIVQQCYYNSKKNYPEFIFKPEIKER